MEGVPKHVTPVGGPVWGIPIPIQLHRPEWLPATSSPAQSAQPGIGITGMYEAQACTIPDPRDPLTNMVPRAQRLEWLSKK
jgi:hypothetical protein